MFCRSKKEPNWNDMNILLEYNLFSDQCLFSHFVYDLFRDVFLCINSQWYSFLLNLFPRYIWSSIAFWVWNLYKTSDSLPTCQESKSSTSLSYPISLWENRGGCLIYWTSQRITLEQVLFSLQNIKGVWLGGSLEAQLDTIALLGHLTDQRANKGPENVYNCVNKEFCLDKLSSGIYSLWFRYKNKKALLDCKLHAPTSSLWI